MFWSILSVNLYLQSRVKCAPENFNKGLSTSNSKSNALCKTVLSTKNSVIWAWYKFYKNRITHLKQNCYGSHFDNCWNDIQKTRKQLLKSFPQTTKNNVGTGQVSYHGSAK